jgi:serine/threonine protein kinase
MQLAAGGSMRQMLDGMGAPLDTAHAVALMQDTAAGMAFLHGKGVLHRDVKSLNLLLDESGRVLVSDFGISKQSSTATATMGGGGGMKGSAPWMAPESIRGQPFTQACDVYAFGIVIWEILSRQTPWEGRDQMQIGFAVANEGARPALEAVQGKLYPEPLIVLMQECWAQDPAARPSFADTVRRLGAL